MMRVGKVTEEQMQLVAKAVNITESIVNLCCFNLPVDELFAPHEFKHHLG